ncbi:hypothetical protein PO002_41325 [Cupriavidus necator]|uniref:hypothetical protein n=1 Tax=Cupriavidus necator TaxID=106590 RepID=UPI0039C29ECF
MPRSERLPPCVVALAGRRIDAAGAPHACFPLANVELVARRIRRALRRSHAVALVCSAACGADLVALDVAAELGLRRRIVLPFDAQRFSETSVRDRPGDWMPAFVRHLDACAREGGLTTLPGTGDDERDYQAANEAILDEAQALARRDHASPLPVLAFAVWDRRPRPEGDATAAFLRLAMLRDFGVLTVWSL